MTIVVLVLNVWSPTSSILRQKVWYVTNHKRSANTALTFSIDFGRNRYPLRGENASVAGMNAVLNPDGRLKSAKGADS